MKNWGFTLFLVMHLFCIQIFAQNNLILDKVSSTEITLKDLSQFEINELKKVFKDEADFFLQLDSLFRQNLTQPVKTIVDTNSIIPLLLYTLENNTSDAFEMSVLDHAQLDLKEQSEFMIRVINKIESDPLLLYRLQKSVQRIDKRLKNLKPQWNWFAQRTMNAALASFGLISFLYSFEASFIYPELKSAFASSMEMAMNLMLLYAGTTILADISAFKSSLTNYLIDRKIISNAKNHIQKIKEILSILQSDQSTSSLFDFAKYLTSPQSRQLVKKWVQNRQQAYQDHIRELKQKPTAWFQLKSRLLKKELEQFRAFYKKIFPQNLPDDSVAKYRMEQTVSNTFSENTPPAKSALEKMNQIEVVFEDYEQKIQEVELLKKKGMQNISKSTISLSIGVAIISFHASLGRESSYLDNLTSPEVMNLIRQNTLYIYYAAAAMVVYPLKNFWFGQGNFRNVSKNQRLQKRYFEESNQLFSKEFLSKHLIISQPMCRQLFLTQGQL